MLRAIFFIVVLLVSYGCATMESCSDRQFFKAFVNGKPNPNRYFLNVAQLDLDDDAILRVSLCARKAVDTVCVEIYPAENVLFQFSEPRLTIFQKSTDVQTNLSFEKISYNISCHGKTLSEEDVVCQSSTISPLVGNEEPEMDTLYSQRVGANYYYRNAYGFPPNAAFRGAIVSVGFLTKFRRKYEAVTQPFQPVLGDEYVVSIPPVYIGNRSVEVPDVSFKYVTDNACLPNRPLSLQ